VASTHTESPTAAPAREASSLSDTNVGLNISIRIGSGTGRTPLSAFDTALLDAGVGDFNLVTLSSVIPPASRLRHVKGPLAGTHGDLLFCVRAEAFADQPGHEAWAGLGWVTDDTGGGLFVEHHGSSEASVVAQIEASLGDMNRNRGNLYGPVQMTLSSAECVDEPVCALVVAAYRVTSWHDGSEPEPAPTAQDNGLVTGPPAASPAPQSGPGGTHTKLAEDWIALDNAVSHNGAGPTEAAEKSNRPRGEVARVSMEKEVDYATARRFYLLYQETFGPLRTVGAARQVLTQEEFLEEMLDPRVRKYVAWDADDIAIGMTTMTTELEAVPWISPDFYAHRYPEHHARNAIYYLGITLVHPDHRDAHVFHAMLEAMAPEVFANHGVVGFDMCQTNDERGLGASAARLITSLTDATFEPVDVQTYYTCVINDADSATDDK